MLKLPNSFSRCLKVTCDSVNYRPHGREFTQLICLRKTCYTGDTLHQSVPSLQPRQPHRLLASFKKKSRIKIPPLNLNGHKEDKAMSDTLQPSSNHASHGGQFDVSKSNINNRHTPSDKSGSSAMPPKFRVWETIAKRSPSTETTLRFRVVSYNVLAQYLLENHPYLYTNCTPKNLKWPVRATHLYDEIIKMAPDILCFQEVQVSHLTTFYARFQEIGYYGIFKQKTGQRQDGCAIYFKEALFHLKDQMSVEFYQPELPILNRDNIGLMAKLVPRSLPGTEIVVATTHLLYNPKRTDVRLAQTQLFLAEIDRFAYYKCGMESGHLPIILTGDLNSTPDSAVYKLLDRGHVSATPFRDNSDWKRIGVTDNCQHLAVYLDRMKGKCTDFSTIGIQHTEYDGGITPPEERCASPKPPGCDQQRDHDELFNSGVLGHQLQLSSVYKTQKTDGSQEATTFQEAWVTVDYIYFSNCSSLKLLQRLRLPTARECDAVGPLPNDDYGSDHLALAATFELRPLNRSL